MNILGLSAFYHDSAAALVRDGQIVAAAQEERFTRIKHDARAPVRAIEYCLREGGITAEQLDYLVFYEKPLLKFDRLMETYLAYAPRGFRSFREFLPVWLREKLFQPRELRRALGKKCDCPLVFVEHHESHAASAFFPSPFENAAIITVDGVGEWATTTIGVGEGHRLRLLQEQRFPHSVGLLYSAFTYYCGFKVNSGEYKLMGLAPYGEPRFAKLILERLIDLRVDGSFRLDLRYFNYCEGLTMTNVRFDDLFGGPPRQAEGDLTQRHMDLAASVQHVTDEIMRRLARHARQLTGRKNLCLAGGVALNCVANGHLERDGIFDHIWIQPAAGDAGGALGAALFTWHQLLDKPRSPKPTDAQRGSLLGPEFSDSQIRTVLNGLNATTEYFEDEEELCAAVANLIADEKVVGLFRGRMEFGPRALGARSIVGDARSPAMQSVMNLKIKFRESFRPFAPAVLREHAHDYFDMSAGTDSPYMLLVAPVRESLRTSREQRAAVGLARLREVRSSLPAVTHVDYSARVQTVDVQSNPLFHNLLQRFYELTGCPVLINTSFNVRGEPIVGSPEDAYRCFMATDMDALVLGNHLLLKTEQPQSSRPSIEKHLAQFQPD
jgi:carbamoyltransferase